MPQPKPGDVLRHYAWRHSRTAQIIEELALEVDKPTPSPIKVAELTVKLIESNQWKLAEQKKNE